MLRPLVLSVLVILLLSACAAPGGGSLGDPRDSVAKEQEQALRIADIAARTGNYAAAINIYRTLLAKRGNDPAILARLGDVYLDARYADEAIIVYERLAEADVTGVAARLGLGRANLQLFRPETAAQHFREALLRTPGNPTVLGLLALAEDLSGNHEAAQGLYQEALTGAPEDKALRNNYALSRLLRGDYEAAAAELRLLAFAEGATVQMRQNLALAYGLQGDEEAAARVARMDLDPESVTDNLRVYAELRRIGRTDLLRRYLIAPPQEAGL